MGVANAVLESSVRCLASDLGSSNNSDTEISPLRRNTDPAEVGDTAVFLASDLGRGVTGNVIYVDAGFQIMGPSLG